MNEQRIIDIESKIAFQEETLQVLNDVICEQQKQIDKLVATCKLLDERINDLLVASSDAQASDEPPPHF